MIRENCIWSCKWNKPGLKIQGESKEKKIEEYSKNKLNGVKNKLYGEKTSCKKRAGGGWEMDAQKQKQNLKRCNKDNQIGKL